MSKWEKLLEKIRNNPKTVTFEEVDRVMKRLGYDGKFPRNGSSHCTYRKPVTHLLQFPGMSHTLKRNM